MGEINVSEQEILAAVVFVRHIKKHLRSDQLPKCPVCKAAIDKIFAAESKLLTEEVPEVVWVQMKREKMALDPNCTVFTLFDPNFHCILDRWEVRSERDHTEMMEDFYMLGLIKFEQLVSARGASQQINSRIVPAR